MAAKGKYHYWISAEGLKRVEDYAREGLTDKQIAQKIGVSHNTFYKWCAMYGEFSDSLKRGKVKPDDEVEQALFKSAQGFSYDEITYERQYDKKTGEYKMVETKRVKKTVPPSNTAQIFWLKNRRPDLWRDKTEQKVTISNAEVVAEMEAYFDDKGPGTVAPEE